MRKNKPGALILCLLLITTFVSAKDVVFDYGATLETIDAMSDTYSYQRRLSPWIDVRFPELNGMRIAAQGSIYIRFNPKSYMFRPILDLDLLSIHSPLLPFCHGSVSFEGGRIMMQDVGGMILNQKVDGVAIHVAVPGIVMDLAAGYHGFQNSLTSSIMLSADDFKESSEKQFHFYGLGARRAIFQWSTLFPEFIGQVDFFGDLIAQIDMRRNWENSGFVRDKKEVQEEVNSAYVTLGARGPIQKVEGLFFSVGGVFQGLTRTTAEKSESYVAYYFDAGLQYFPISVVQVYARLQGGSKNATGISEYRPISYKAAGTLYEGGFNDIIKPEIGVKWKTKGGLAFNSSLACFIAPRKIKKLDRENFENVYKYTEFAIGGNGVIANDLNIQADLMLGTNNVREDKKFDFALRLKCNMSL